MIFPKQKNVIVVGCGRLGSGIANVMYKKGYNVIAIDKNKEAFNLLPDSFSGFETVGDGTDIDLLKSVGIESAEMVIAVTESDNTNSLIAQIASRLFSVRKGYIRLNDESKKELINGFDVDAICPKLLVISELEKLIEGEKTKEDEEEDELS